VFILLSIILPAKNEAVALAGLLPRLRTLFAGAVAAQPAGRAVTPLLWWPDQGEPLSFSCVISRWSAGSTLWALDLYPADGETWQHGAGVGEESGGAHRFLDVVSSSSLALSAPARAAQDRGR